MNISIIYEDEDILVINKPAGVTVNKAETTRHEITIQDWAEDHLQIANKTWVAEGHTTPPETNLSQYGDPVRDFVLRAGIVHRLDKETSGILILAKNPSSFTALQKQFKERVVEKIYIALAHGKVLPSEGEINVPVGRLPWNRKQFGIVPGGRESTTFYKVIDYYCEKPGDSYSLLELKPRTGRTHQIRVHLKYIGHPIFADFLYAGRKTARNDRKILNRVFLHAAKITFTHPKTGEKVSFESPQPEEFSKVFAKLTIFYV